MRVIWIGFLLMLTLWLAGCGSLPATNPLASETMVVSSVSGDKQLQLHKDQVWFDGPSRSLGIMIPKGDYVLSAEDEDYLYFKAPAQIELRIFSEGGYHQGLFDGGLALSKGLPDLMVPAFVYQDSNDEQKTMRWKLGGDFLRMEGRTWEKNY